MSIVTTETTSIDQEEAADTCAVLEHLLHKTPLDPSVYRRVHERAERITESLRQKHGVLNIAVDLVREGRDEG